jgi:hypothetical protein
VNARHLRERLGLLRGDLEQSSVVTDDVRRNAAFAGEVEACAAKALE